MVLLFLTFQILFEVLVLLLTIVKKNLKLSTTFCQLFLVN